MWLGNRHTGEATTELRLCSDFRIQGLRGQTKPSEYSRLSNYFIKLLRVGLRVHGQRSSRSPTFGRSHPFNGREGGSPA